MGRVFVFIVISFMSFPLKALSQLHLKPLPDSISPNQGIKILPQNFYINHLGWFCKKEFQLQQKLKMNVYFRLGSKEETDRWEIDKTPLKSN